MRKFVAHTVVRSTKFVLLLLLVLLIIKVFIKHKMLSVETILSAYTNARTHTHTHAGTHMTDYRKSKELVARVACTHQVVSVHSGLAAG